MPKRRRILWFVVVAVGVVVVAGVIVATTDSGPAVTAADPGGANLWVSSAGGSCMRRAVRSSQTPSRDCRSLNAAYHRAHCGDIVDIDPGNYPVTQDIQDDPALDACTTPVVFQPAPGARVTLANVEAGNYGDVTTNGASWWTLRDVSLGNRLAVLPPAHNVTLDHIRGGSFYLNGVRDMRIENSTFGPCYSGRILTGECDNNSKVDSGYDSGGSAYTTTGVDIVDNTFHDYLNNGDTHFECMFMVGGTDITFNGNHFAHCQNYGIFIQPYSGQPYNKIVIENNSFYKTRDDAGSTIYAVDFGGNGGNISNMLIRDNRFAPDEGVTEDGGPLVGTNDRVIGNVGGDYWYEPCIAGITYADNVWNGRPCSATDKVMRRLPYVDAAVGDLRLQSGASR